MWSSPEGGEVLRALRTLGLKFRLRAKSSGPPLIWHVLVRAAKLPFAVGCKKENKAIIKTFARLDGLISSNVFNWSTNRSEDCHKITSTLTWQVTRRTWTVANIESIKLWTSLCATSQLLLCATSQLLLHSTKSSSLWPSVSLHFYHFWWSSAYFDHMLMMVVLTMRSSQVAE